MCVYVLRWLDEEFDQNILWQGVEMITNNCFNSEIECNSDGLIHPHPSFFPLLFFPLLPRSNLWLHHPGLSSEHTFGRGPERLCAHLELHGVWLRLHGLGADSLPGGGVDWFRLFVLVSGGIRDGICG